MLGQLPEDPYAPVVRDVLITAISTCASRGYFVLPIPEPADVNASFPFVRSLLGEVDLAGVICETTSKQRFLGQLLDEVDVPVMWMSLVEKPDDFHGSGHIRIDEQAGVRELVSNIDISGDATALMLTGPNLDYSRHKPFMNKFGSQVRQINLPDWTSATAQKTVSQILKNETNIGLIWAVDDPLAVGALAACEEARIAVPDQIQIAGFGPQSDPTAQLAGITSVDWPLQQMTELAVTNLIESLSGKAPATNPVVDLATKAVWRKTTR
ncbi:hypothetical protein HMPREF3198_02095 [Winkia neuii]|nr:hypothetical protein HMPREF3198_02095 [Winkia neuii]